jgi:regulator of protease activity HflC (stomatin/prohibitin superfamily)
MEERAFRVPGFPVLSLVIVGAVGLCGLANRLGQDQPAAAGIIVVFGIVVLLLVFTRVLIVNPNQARVIQFFGQYLGTINRPRLHWTVPMSTKRHASLRVRNFEAAKLKKG